MIIGIDPGSNGGIAYEFNGEIFAKKMPETKGNIYSELATISLMADGYENAVCYLEKVGGYMPGNSGPAAVKFARHCGNIEMALIALKIKRIEVSPQKWMNYFVGKLNYPVDITPDKKKTLRKNVIKKRAQAIYPHLKVTLALSDALGILNYGINDTREIIRERKKQFKTTIEYFRIKEESRRKNPIS